MSKPLRKVFGYTNAVLKSKPTRRSGEDLRDFPTYTVPEAAVFLGIPVRTMREWFSGSQALLSPSGRVADLPLLSFKDMVEAYALFLLRSEHRFSMQEIRRVMGVLPKFTKARHPLISENLKIFRDNLMLDRPARGRNARQVINLSRDGQLAIPDIVDVFSNRVLRNSAGNAVAIFPWRLWFQDSQSKPVQISPDVMSGRLVVTGTRIPVSILQARHRNGESIEAMALDYELSVESIDKALRHLEKAA
jgi:uncharacterized protein (DUF433 family)